MIASFYCDLYRVKITLGNGGDDKKLHNLMIKAGDPRTYTEFMEDHSMAAATTTKLNNDEIFIHVNKKADTMSYIEHTAMLAHECVHVVGYILGPRGIDWKDETDEAYAYLLEWVLLKILCKYHFYVRRKKK